MYNVGVILKPSQIYYDILLLNVFVLVLTVMIKYYQKIQLYKILLKE